MTELSAGLMLSLSGAQAEMEALLDPKAFTGRSAHQVEAFVAKVLPRIAEEDGTAINSQIEI